MVRAKDWEIKSPGHHGADGKCVGVEAKPMALAPADGSRSAPPEARLGEARNRTSGPFPDGALPEKRN